VSIDHVGGAISQAINSLTRFCGSFIHNVSEQVAPFFDEVANGFPSVRDRIARFIAEVNDSIFDIVQGGRCKELRRGRSQIVVRVRCGWQGQAFLL
jgi:hypothetical protein